MIRTTLLSIAFLSIISSTAFASGGGASYGGSYNSKPKAIDTKYEYGKTVYQGRAKKVGKVSFCVANGNSVTPVKASSLRPFKKGSVRNLTSSLYDCDNTSQKISDKISSKDLSYVVYYLNKRFRLRLNNG